MSSTHGKHPVVDTPRDQDGVAMGKIVAVGVISLVAFAICSVIAALILKTEGTHLRETRGAPPIPAMMGKDEIGIVDQVPFDGDRRLEEWRAAKRKRLSTYGWSDRSKSQIHIPIDKAMDEVVSQAAANPPPAGATP